MNKLQNSPLLGCTVSLCQPDYLKGVVNQALKYDAKAITFSLGSLQRYELTNKNKLDSFAFAELLKKHNFNQKLIAIHASYLINLANFSVQRIYDNSVKLLKETVALAAHAGINKIILHPGAALKNDRKMASNSIVTGLNEVLSDYPNAEILLETMSGKGSEIGKNFEELKYIIENCRFSKQIKVCFDTCHLFASGYDIIQNFDGVLKVFDQQIGLKKLAALHINDSMFGLKSFKDRHANIGEGEIGLKALRKIVHHSKLEKLPMFLETPHFEKKPLFEKEIKMLM